MPRKVECARSKDPASRRATLPHLPNEEPGQGENGTYPLGLQELPAAYSIRRPRAKHPNEVIPRVPDAADEGSREPAFVLLDWEQKDFGVVHDQIGRASCRGRV